jgi:hypothetical protein
VSYLDALERELRQAGIPRRRRNRIVAEFADHLDQNPAAELGSPLELARQFADQLGTRRARRTAFVAFVGIAITGVACLAVALGTRIVRLPPGVHQVGLVARSWSPVPHVYLLAAQTAVACGLLAVLRAWRLRRVPVIAATEAAVLYRRAGVGLFAGIVTVASAPLADTAGPGWVSVRNGDVGGWCFLMLLAIVPFALESSQLRPSLPGSAGDLRFDMGNRYPRATPWRFAVLASAVGFVALTIAGAVGGNFSHGFARGTVDAVACILGFIVLGNYLGLRSRTTG